MKIVVDSNIIFSAILKTESNIGQLLTNSKNYFDFYTINYSHTEIENHKNKIISITKYSDWEYQKVTELISTKIHYINEAIIPPDIYEEAIKIVAHFDIDDAYFVAISLYLNAKLWTGDKKLINNLAKNGYRNTLTTEKLYQKFLLKEQKAKRF